MGKDVISKIVFVCSDMWEPYLKPLLSKLDSSHQGGVVRPA